MKNFQDDTKRWFPPIYGNERTESASASEERPLRFTQSRRFYPLSGIIKCAGCGRPLQGNHTESGQAYRYYREVAHRRGVACSQPQIAARADRVEAMVDEIVKRFRAPKQLRKRVVEMLADGASGEDPSIQIARLKERLRRIARLYADLRSR
ncbi:zinc ribbon domain-containing protein [Candidatus Amarobacter glycogenicus]|uniref:zinc ribbon domain-containing protein n=1 Tax=Candidatus Amarobacter glycogenicus TaxID=3140699 RepID=UPI003135DEB2|nr:recombinase zinc beta ribbon domain-containing protein [Dehalococcoidia bacterium]